MKVQAVDIARFSKAIQFGSDVIYSLDVKKHKAKIYHAPHGVYVDWKEKKFFIPNEKIEFLELSKAE